MTNLSLALTMILFITGDLHSTTAINDGFFYTDNDGDGYSVEEGDCDDTNFEIFPYALETCNGKDDDCDGEIDEIAFKPYENITVSLDANGEKIITPSDLMSEFNFPCGMGEIKIRPGIVTCSDIGTGTARIKVQAADGTEYSATINMTVIDNMAPIITPFWGNHFSLGHNTGDPTRLIIAAHEISNYNDNCGIFSTSLSRNEFTCSDIGWQWVELTVEDISHNISREWILIDVQSGGPIPLCRNEINVALNASGTAHITPDLLDAGSTSPCGMYLYLNVIGGPLVVDCRHVNTTILYTLEIMEVDSWKTASCITAVTINDPANTCIWGRSRKEAEPIVSLNFYPNPVNEKLNINWEAEGSNDNEIQLTDMFGRIIKQFSNQELNNANVSVNTSSYRPGMYFINLLQEGRIVKSTPFLKN